MLPGFFKYLFFPFFLFSFIIQFKIMKKREMGWFDLRGNTIAYLNWSIFAITFVNYGISVYLIPLNLLILLKPFRRVNIM
jgi:hypothetical protein